MMHFIEQLMLITKSSQEHYKHPNRTHGSISALVFGWLYRPHNNIHYDITTLVNSKDYVPLNDVDLIHHNQW